MPDFTLNSADSSGIGLVSTATQYGAESSHLYCVNTTGNFVAQNKQRLVEYTTNYVISSFSHIIQCIKKFQSLFIDLVSGI